MKMGSNYGFLSQKLASLIQLLSVYLIPFFCFISTYVSRLLIFGYSFKRTNKDSIFLEPEGGAGKDNSESGHQSELHLKFKFPSFDEFSRRGNSCNSELLSSANSDKYKFASGKISVSAFIEILTTFSVKDINGDKIGAKFVENRMIEAIEFQEKTENDSHVGKEVKEFEGNQDFLDLDSEKNSDGFLSDGDFREEMDVGGEHERIGLESSELGECFGDEVSEIKNVEEHNLQHPVELNSDFLSDRDFHEVSSDKKTDAKFVAIDDVGMKGRDNSGKTKQNDSLAPDSNRLELLWEHQELIEQLQMELKKANATGLPTILEESESPKLMDELKPWRIDDKFQHENCMGELHKFYKSYREMMRKFDILNYQKMYATGFLQLKDPFQSSQQKPLAPTLKSLVSENLWLFKHRSHGSDPVKKFVNELQGDLEVVYVGQLCLSWEFLHWQYEKVLDLWNSDPHGVHRYNEVAGEFQQFQVLSQRFIENEPFQGPRVQSYVKSRCVLRNLLQVPLVREDCLEEKNKGRRKEIDEYAITSEILVEIVEESIRIFWEFFRSDKDCAVSTNGRKKMPDLHSLPDEDLKLLQEVRKTLQKKEKKLKDILRSENCILRKFRQNREDDLDQVLHFFSQVDMKLVSRVLNMSKISRDQLLWCQNKLRRISFVNRKIHVESGFLPFPC